MLKYSAAPDQHYDRVSKAWRYLLGDDLHYGYFQSPGDSLRQATTNLTAKMAAAGHIEANQVVLDVGCGVGGPALWLVERTQCDILGISTSRQGLEEARRLTTERGLSNHAQFQFGDGMRNGLPDSFR